MKTKRVLTLFAIALQVFTAMAQDRQFARTYQTLTLPKDAKDLEVWNTYRTGRRGFYNRLDQRVEFEVGLTDKLQTAFYLNASHKAYNIQGDTLGTINKASEFSFSNEWKWKLTDPVANMLGSALYAELTVASDEIELEGKLIFDKKIDKHLFAFNAVGELEFENEVKIEQGKQEKELELEEKTLEFDFAYLFNLKPDLGIGFELRNHNVFDNGGALEHSALFGGPTLFYSGNKNFIILNILPQWVNLKTKMDGNLELTGHEKAEIRLLVGFSF